MFLDFTQDLTINALNSYIKHNQLKLKVGLTNGCFDLTHLYHLKYLERCRRQCDILIVGVDDDPLVSKVKGITRPVFDLTTRLALVEQSRYVAGVFVIRSLSDFYNMARLIRPHYIFNNGTIPEDKVIGKDFCDRVIVIEDLTPITSTTNYIKKIKTEN